MSYILVRFFGINVKVGPTFCVDIPVDELFDHFRNLHSSINPLSLSSDHNTLEEDISTLEETKAAFNYLDITILPTEIESITKSLGSRKAPGPDKRGPPRGGACSLVP